MIKLSVKAVAGIQCGTDAEGTRLGDMLFPLLESGQNVELDFDGVELASSSFFNASIGLAFSKFGEKFVRDHVAFSNLKPRVQFVLDRTLSAYAKAV